MQLQLMRILECIHKNKNKTIITKTCNGQVVLLLHFIRDKQGIEKNLVLNS